MTWLDRLPAGVDLTEWPVLVLGEWNVGPAHTLPLLRAAAIAFSEAGDQWRHGGVIDQARGAGYCIISGSEPGQSSTPLGFHPAELRLIKAERHLLAERQDVGPGAGPDMLKQKWAIGGLFEHIATGRRLWVFAVHYVATQGKPKRHRVALAMTNRMLLLARGFHRPVFMLGDTNAEPTSVTLRAFRKAGWLVNQLVGKTLGTHGRRAIDQCWWTPRGWIQFLRHHTVKTASDHDAVVVEFAIRPRRKVRR